MTKSTRARARRIRRCYSGSMRRSRSTISTYDITLFTGAACFHKGREWATCSFVRGARPFPRPYTVVFKTRRPSS
jgi:hypothetical protein